MKHLHFYYLWLLPFLLVSCGEKKNGTETTMAKSNYKSFATTTVALDTVNNSVNLTGRIVPLKKVAITSEVQGILKGARKKFEEGVRFRKGELLLSIDNEKFKYSLAAQKSQFVSTLVNSMSDIQLDYPEEFNKWNGFLGTIDVKKPLPPLPETENKRLAYFLSGKNIENEYYNIKSQEAELSDYQLYAPFDGVITEANVDVGDLVQPGVSLGEFIYTDSYEILSSVSASNLKFLRLGQEIDFYVTNINKKVAAKVNRFSENLDESTQSVNVYLTVRDSELRSGMYVEGDLPLNSYEKAIEISKDLLTRDEQVHVIEDSTIVSRKVKVVHYNEDTAIVQGLQDGDQLITEQITATEKGIKAIPKL